MNKKGQSVLSEHVMIFFVVIAAIVAMTTFVERSFKARIYDARNFMINSVSNVCDENCQQAAGGNIQNEYEPYYSISIANVDQNSVENHGETPGSANSIGAIYYNEKNLSTNTVSTSVQLPPCEGPFGNAQGCYQ